MANMVHSIGLFEKKYKVDGTLHMYKACFVANGKNQRPVIDCDETINLIIKLTSTRTILRSNISRYWSIRQLDVKNVFLHDQLHETVYIYQPPDFHASIHMDLCLPPSEVSLWSQTGSQCMVSTVKKYITWIGFVYNESDSHLFIFRNWRCCCIFVFIC